jgi:excisionase family DNA binding protein
MSLNEPDFISTKQAAEILDLSVQYVRDLCLDGRMNCFKLPGGRDWLIPRSEVEEYQRTRRPPGRPPKSSTEEE